jgi:hypothetical protein
LPYVAQVRGHEVCVLTADTLDEIAWFACPSGFARETGLVPHPSGKAWVGARGARLYHFAFEDSD